MSRAPGPNLLPLLALLSLLLAGCSSTTPAPVYGWNWSGPVPQGYYLVRRGDTLGLIAQRVGVGSSKLAQWNRLRPPYTVYADTLLRVAPPDGSTSRRPASERTAADAAGREQGRRTSTAAPPAPEVADGERSDDASASRRAASGIVWAWPLDGALIQRFRGGDRTHQGIRIAADPGDEVHAASAGQVVYSGSGLKGYGNLIIIKHNDKYLSAYGFNRKLFVAEGERVRRGQVVAEVGQRAEGVCVLHFEIRRNGVAVDPLLYLPPRD